MICPLRIAIDKFFKLYNAYMCNKNKIIYIKFNIYTKKYFMSIKYVKFDIYLYIFNKC